MNTLGLAICLIVLFSCKSTVVPSAKSSLTNALTSDNEYLVHRNFQTCEVPTSFHQDTFSKSLGIITETGVIVGDKLHSIIIKKIDESSLLTMPQFKVEEKSLFIPNVILSKDSYE